jgi:hypothetical protein
MKGVVENIRGTVVVGWAFDPQDPTPLELRLEYGGKVVGSTTADIARGDIQQAFGRDLSGFRFDCAGLLGISPAQLLQKLRVVADTPQGPRPVPLWSRLTERLEQDASTEQKAARLGGMEREAARDFLRQCLADIKLQEMQATLWPALQLAKHLSDTPEFQACRGFIAYGREQFGDCVDLLTDDLLAQLAVQSEAVAMRGADLRIKAAYALGRFAQAAAFLAAAAARAWPADETTARAIRSRLAETDQPKPDFSLPAGYTLLLTGHFKWSPDMFPHWGSVFMGTTDDPVASLPEIIAALEQIPAEKRHLVAIVGGMWFLRLIGRLRFGRITVFDSNVAELAKVAHARETVLRTEFADFDGFRGLDSMIRRAFSDFYLPAALRDVRIEKHGFHFTYDGRTTPVETTISPLDYPALAWQPTRQEYDLARENLATAFDKVLHLRIPRLAPGMFGVAYLTHVPFSRETLTRDLGSRHVIPIYARSMDNAAALDPHVYWEWRALDLAGPHRTVHLWAPEDSALCGGVYDEPFSLGATHDAFCNRADFPHGGCLIIHMYLSKRCDESVEERMRKLADVLTLAAPRYRRILVSENIAHEAAARQAADAVLRPAFELGAEPVYTPGLGQARRNVFLSYWNVAAGVMQA